MQVAGSGEVMVGDRVQVLFKFVQVGDGSASRDQEWGWLRKGAKGTKGASKQNGDTEQEQAEEAEYEQASETTRSASFGQT